MLLKLSQHIEKSSPLRRVYKGVVVSNSDPKKLGRVKVNIEGLLVGATASLPWCSPRKNSFLGGSNNSGSVAVPEVGSELEIQFPFESVYMPFYYGYWESLTTHVSDFDTNYPEAYGWKDKIGNIFRINKTLKTLFVNIVEKIEIFGGKDILISTSGGNFKAKGTAEGAIEAELIKLGTSPSFHAAIAENIVAYNDAHIHPEQQPLAPFTAPPLIPMGAKAGTVMDVAALRIMIKGNA